jgi:hypothetical protein
MEDSVRFIPKTYQKLSSLALVLMVATIHADSFFTVVTKGRFD